MVEIIRKGVDVLFDHLGPRKLIMDFRRGASLGKKGHLIASNKSRINSD